LFKFFFSRHLTALKTFVLNSKWAYQKLFWFKSLLDHDFWSPSPGFSDQKECSGDSPKGPKGFPELSNFCLKMIHLKLGQVTELALFRFGAPCPSWCSFLNFSHDLNIFTQNALFPISL